MRAEILEKSVGFRGGAQWAGDAEAVDDFFQQIDPFQVVQLFAFLFENESVGVVADDFVAETVESADFDVIGRGADDFNQTAAHGGDAGVGESQTENIEGVNLRFQQDFGDAHGQDLRLARAGAGDDHDGALDIVDGFPLLGVEGVVIALEGRQPVGGSGWRGGGLWGVGVFRRRGFGCERVRGGWRSGHEAVRIIDANLSQILTPAGAKREIFAIAVAG